MGDDCATRDITLIEFKLNLKKKTYINIIVTSYYVCPPAAVIVLVAFCPLQAIFTGADSFRACATPVLFAARLTALVVHSAN